MTFLIQDVTEEVIKTTDFEELNILDFNPVAWYDASDPSTITADGSGLVSEWRDKSGNGGLADQPIGTAQPTLVNSSPVMGGRSALHFDGVNDVLNVDLTSLSNTSYTVLFVTARGDSRSDNYLIGSSSTSINRNMHIGYRTNTTVTHAHYGNDLNTSVPSYTSQKPTIFSAVYSDRKFFYIDGELAIQDTSPTASLATITGGRFGALRPAYGFYFGLISEIIIFDRALPDTERQAIERHLMTKYMSPAPIPPEMEFVNLFKPQLWLDSSDETTITIDGSGYISEWKDKSGNGRHFAQSNSSIRPEYVNGVVEFNVNRAFLARTLDSTLIRTVFITYLNKSSLVNSVPFTSSYVDFKMFWHGTVNQLFNSNFTRPEVLNAIHYLNGISINSNDVFQNSDSFVIMNINTTDEIDNGSYTWFVGNDRELLDRNVDAIKEVIVFDRVLNTAERKAIEKYLIKKNEITEYVDPEESFINGFSPIAWFSGSDSSTIKRDGTGAVYEWQDKSGNLRHISQSVDSDKPKKEDGYIRFQSDVLIGNGNQISNKNYHAFFVIKYGFSGSGDNYFWGTDGTTFFESYHFGKTNSTQWRYAQGSNQGVKPTFDYAENISNIALVTLKDFNGEQIVTENGNNVLLRSSLPSQPANNNNLMLGSGHGSPLNYRADNVDIYEAIFIENLSDTEQQAVETYLMEKYNITT